MKKYILRRKYTLPIFILSLITLTIWLVLELKIGFSVWVPFILTATFSDTLCYIKDRLYENEFVKFTKSYYVFSVVSFICKILMIITYTNILILIASIICLIIMIIDGVVGRKEYVIENRYMSKKEVSEWVNYKYVIISSLDNRFFN